MKGMPAILHYLKHRPIEEWVREANIICKEETHNQSTDKPSTLYMCVCVCVRVCVYYETQLYQWSHQGLSQDL